MVQTAAEKSLGKNPPTALTSKLKLKVFINLDKLTKDLYEQTHVEGQSHRLLTATYPQTHQL